LNDEKLFGGTVMSLKEKIENAKKTSWVTDGIDPNEVRSTVINARLAAQIRLARQDLGLTREQLAKQLNVSQYTISKWENPEHDFSISDLCKIAMELNIEDYLIKLLTNIKR
jgi:ribosome-binding protein aMBF1 (putative translation factor)